MKANVRNSSSLGLLVVVVILLNGHCRGITAVKSNATYKSCNGPMDDCFIIEVGMEVLLDTEINIRLLEGVSSGTSGTSNSGSPASCGHPATPGHPYIACHPPPKPHQKNCGTFPPDSCANIHNPSNP